MEAARRRGRVPRRRGLAVNASMKANRRRDTGPELALRRALHALGARYRVDHPVAVDPAIAGRRAVRVDVAFPGSRLAVQVNGCFWHACERHGSVPRTPQGYWGPKLRRNVERDVEVEAALRAAGWAVVTVWEHDLRGVGADRLAAVIRDLARSRRAQVGRRTA